MNAATPTRARGVEFLARVTRGPWQAIASYTDTHSVGEGSTGPERRDIPLVPRQTAELAGIWEREGKGRAGIEVSYTGTQRLEDDPYREFGRSYVTVNALGEIRFGETGVFINAANLTDVRQTGFDPVVRPTPAPDGRWLTDAWAPLEGRVVNAGVRWEF